MVTGSPEERTATDRSAPSSDDIDLREVLAPVFRHWVALIVLPLLAAAAAIGLSYLVKPMYTARTSFIAPQRGQSSAIGTALASLGPLASLSGSSLGQSTGDLYVSLLQSSTLSDRIIDRFKLQQAYALKFRFEARQELAHHARIALGKKDGLITIEFDDTDPQRAAEIANRYVEELRSVTAKLALTEAQRRRAFFEEQLKAAKDRLTAAQQALQGTGYGSAALKAEPRAAAEEYARIKAEATAAEVKLQALKRNLTAEAPEVTQQQALLSALQNQLHLLERNSPPTSDADYIGRYREFKYQETLFDLLARQFEAAKLDESREDVLIQVVDRAEPPEWKSSPKRSTFALVGYSFALLALTVFLVVRGLRSRVSRRR